MLLSLLKDFENLFDDTLGDWATKPVDLELNPDSILFNRRYYPVPRINKEKIRKYLKHLVDIGVRTPVQKRQYNIPIFIIRKKEGTVMFISDYHRLNQQLVRNPYTLPRIGETMQQLEGFQYATALDPNMGYYTIRLSPASQDMTMIGTRFGKFRYNCLPMGMCASRENFQTKVDKLLGDIEGVKTYIDDILVLGKDSFEKLLRRIAP